LEVRARAWTSATGFISEAKLTDVSSMMMVLQLKKVGKVFGNRGVSKNAANLFDLFDFSNVLFRAGSQVKDCDHIQHSYYVQCMVFCSAVQYITTKQMLEVEVRCGATSQYNNMITREVVKRDVLDVHDSPVQNIY
jgi:hypothetical protein